MAMTLPIAIPATSAGNISSPEESSLRTPVSPNDNQTVALPASQDQSSNTGSPEAAQQNAGATQVKRKPSRRANTAERRATHNAVERARRETLNGRFLDLAALLPNLSQIRRPSKSSIVNSSIAHIGASRRHRLLASRELRLLKLESDALRRELNEWRDRAGLPRVEEPPRSEGFGMVLSGEVEVLTAVIEEEAEDGDDFDGYGEDNDFNGGARMAADTDEDMRFHMLKNANANPFAHNLPPSVGSNSSMHPAHIRPRPSGPMIASPTSVSFENPAMPAIYEGSQGPYPAQFMNQGMAEEKFAAWNAQLYNAAALGNHPLAGQRPALYTPPGSAMSSAPPSSAGNGGVNPFADPEMIANFHRQQVLAMQQHGNMGHMYGSPDRDDASSVASGASLRHRERSGSLSGGSGYGSPQHGSPLGNYELSAAEHSEYAMSKRFPPGLQINTSVAGQWHGRGESAVEGMPGMMKQTLSPPISVGGGGNGHGFAMMMM